MESLAFLFLLSISSYGQGLPPVTAVQNGGNGLPPVMAIQDTKNSSLTQKPYWTTLSSQQSKTYVKRALAILNKQNLKCEDGRIGKLRDILKPIYACFAWPDAGVPLAHVQETNLLLALSGPGDCDDVYFTVESNNKISEVRFRVPDIVNTSKENIVRWRFFTCNAE